MNNLIKHIVEDFNFNNVKHKLLSDLDFSQSVIDSYVVDLGLPYGTLWFKYNLGVQPKLLSKPEDWYGDYYMWGDIEPNKKQYDWESYCHFDKKFGVYPTFKKYTYNQDLQKISSEKIDIYKGYYPDIFNIKGPLYKSDNLFVLQPEDDAATVRFKNSNICTPTKEQFIELLENTDERWVTNYNGITGLNGYVFKSKTNNNELFMPATGYYNNVVDNDGKFCHMVGVLAGYWSSSLYLDNDPSNASLLMFSPNNCIIGNSSRNYGLNIRPVLEK